jgi:hypothetical protein
LWVRLPPRLLPRNGKRSRGPAATTAGSHPENDGSSPSGITELVRGQLSVVSCNGQLMTADNGQRTTDNGQRTTDNGQRTTDNLGLQVLWTHPSVVRKWAGFDSRVDLPRGRGCLASNLRWVRFPSSPLNWAAGPTGRRRHRTSEIGVQFPGGPLIEMGSWSKGTMPARHAGDPGSTPGGSTDIRKVAGYRLAGPPR